ncbi:MAG: hypothetical protein GX483_05585 [Actinomycetaceae bacterium]|nr:hypothetical protein [Actinomycetaceae bacterium]
MQITPGLSVFWRETDQIQIGLDTRTGIVLEGLNAAELAMVDSLTRPQGEIELRERARKTRIPVARLSNILSMLRRANVLVDEVPPIPDSAAWLRTRHAVPFQRADVSVEFSRLNYVSVAIALLLADAGIGGISSTDETSIGTNDHPLLVGQYFAMPLLRALTKVLRERYPEIRLGGVAPGIAVVSGSHLVDPVVSRTYLARELPVLHVWIEEVDIFVGPFSRPRDGACGSCLYLHRRDNDPLWDRIAPQALGAREILGDISAMQLAATLAAREIIAFADEDQPTLTNRMWRIGPNNAPPELLEITPHPDCGCQKQPDYAG